MFTPVHQRLKLRSNFMVAVFNKEVIFKFNLSLSLKEPSNKKENWKKKCDERDSNFIAK